MKKLIIVGLILTVACVFVKAESKIKVFPNPWIPEADVSLADYGDTKKYGSLDSDGWIKFQFEEVPTHKSGELLIYDVTGNLVKSRKWKLPEYVPLPQANPADNPEKTIHWDGRDNSYQYVESGVYIWIIYIDGDRKQNGKIVVIR
ncbi:hypothetical protein [Candidatus Ruminimicrobium bovinum]|uniref:hypothetical protein n=1 Tax=Candidatus Ruminimicrobium bovinum TaxID=3242779 RepID=UPI0039B836F5